MNNKQNYFFFQNKSLKQQSNRKQRGEKEVIIALDIRDEVYSLLGENIVGLGSGDHH